MDKLYFKLVAKMNHSNMVSAIRRGMIMVIPVLLLGAIAQVLMNFPVKGYQEFVCHAFSGAFLEMLKYTFYATIGMLSFYVAFSITCCYVSSRGHGLSYVFIAGVTSVVCFVVLSGWDYASIMDGNYGKKGIFTAIICAIGVSSLYVLIVENIKLPFRFYADGVDLEFNDAIMALVPVFTVTIVACLVNYFVSQVFGVRNFQHFYVGIINHVFAGKTSSFLNGFTYVVISGLLSFFGISGKEVMENSFNKIFNLSDSALKVTGIDETVAGRILSVEFFECFIMMGGVGAAFGLLFAIAVFSKRRISKNLMKICSIPMIFNISDVLMYGYPIIFNAYMLIPFIVVPVVCYCTSFIAFYTGMVPAISHSVNSSVPIFISGYMATGSIAGTVLQLVNIIIGVIIYLPFVKLYDASKAKDEEDRMDELTNIMKKAEEEKADIEILKVPGPVGGLAKCLAADLNYAIDHDEIALYYQLQYDSDYNCIGAETLMRYNHPIYGFIYPPLIVKIASEANILGKLERYLFRWAAHDYRRLKSVTDKRYKISVNVTISTLFEKDFIPFLYDLKRRNNIKENEMCIEITEQMAITSDVDFEKALTEIRKLGFMIAIDDFSMGSTSVKYLQNNHFDMVKLDGAIVREMMVNERSKEIILSIVGLAQSLNFMVLAEFVETEEQIEELMKIGVYYYQGYYFSKPVKVDEFLHTIIDEREGRSKLKLKLEEIKRKKEQSSETNNV